MGASQYVYYELAPELLDRLGLSRLPFPLRREMVDKVFQDRQVDFGLMLEELDRFISEHPESGALYQRTITVLSYILAIRAGAAGDPQKANSLLGLGLKHQPENLGLRANHAFSLHMMGRYDEAISEYRELIAEPANDHDPLIRLLAARAMGDSGDPKSAYEVLLDCPVELAGDHGFDNLLDHYRHEIDRLSRKQTEPAPEVQTESTPQPSDKFCRQCGKPLRPGAGFCSSCGKAVNS